MSGFVLTLRGICMALWAGEGLATPVATLCCNLQRDRVGNKTDAVHAAAAGLMAANFM